MYPTRILLSAASPASKGPFLQRHIRNIRRTPIELVPLFICVGFGIVIGGGSMAYKLVNDPSLRIKRENVRGKHAAAAAEKH
ncbi:hypothetical protein BX600DRAFT_461273 [Xylariales sp. PMI_506]|nr:hypothetical protein BX600DRAFT_461273 [Xylariales sp. PMI_506]